jgi:hypothetical protein
MSPELISKQPSASNIHPSLNGIGMLEPQVAMQRYLDAFTAILESWALKRASVTPLQIEMCNAFSVLRHSLDKNEAQPEKYDSDSAIRLIKENGLENGLGL